MEGGGGRGQPSSVFCMRCHFSDNLEVPGRQLMFVKLLKVTSKTDS